MNLDSNVQLSFKVLQLFLLFGKVEAVIVESYLTKRDGVTGFLGLVCEALEFQ